MALWAVGSGLCVAKLKYSGEPGGSPASGRAVTVHRNPCTPTTHS